MSTVQGIYQGSVRGTGPPIDHVILDLRLLILLLIFVAANIYRHHFCQKYTVRSAQLPKWKCHLLNIARLLGIPRPPSLSPQSSPHILSDRRNCRSCPRHDAPPHWLISPRLLHYPKFANMWGPIRGERREWSRWVPSSILSPRRPMRLNGLAIYHKCIHSFSSDSVSLSLQTDIPATNNSTPAAWIRKRNPQWSAMMR